MKFLREISEVWIVFFVIVFIFVGIFGGITGLALALEEKNCYSRWSSFKNVSWTYSTSCMVELKGKMVPANSIVFYIEGK